MSQQDWNEWLADVWQAQAQSRTQAMGVLSTPSDSTAFADAMMAAYEQRFKLMTNPQEPA